MLLLINYYEIIDYLHVGEEDYLNLLTNVKENYHPLPKRPLIKHEPIDTAIQYTLVNSNCEKSPGKSQYVSKYRCFDVVKNSQDRCPGL